MIVDILILSIAGLVCICGLVYAIKLRLISNKKEADRAFVKKALKDRTAFKAKITSQKGEFEVIRIFEELENKAAETNPELISAYQTFNANDGLLSFNEFVANTNEEPTLVTSNHVTI